MAAEICYQCGEAIDLNEDDYTEITAMRGKTHIHTLYFCEAYKTPYRCLSKYLEDHRKE